jgi:hypothetical protein
MTPAASLRPGLSRALIFVGLMLVAVLSTGGEAGVSATADQSYTDARNDSGAGPDIIAATVRHDSAGNVVFQVETSNFPATNHVVSVYIDTDGDQVGETWLWGGKAWSEDTWGAYVFNGTGWVKRSAPSFSATGVGGKVTGYRINVRAIGVTSSRFRFFLRSSSVDYGSSGWQTVNWDIAPASGGFTYELASNQPVPPPPPPPPPPRPPRGLEVARQWVTPDPPQAGKRVVVGANFIFSGTRQPARVGAVSCRGSLGSRSIRGTSKRRGAAGTCAFTLPASAAGKSFRARVQLNYRGVYAFSQASARVVGASRLVIRSLGTNVAAPRAGQVFQASFAVERQQDGLQTQRVDKALVLCTSTIDGKSVRARKARYLPDFLAAQCEWVIPSYAGGSTLRGRVTVTAAGLTASKSFSYPIR